MLKKIIGGAAVAFLFTGTAHAQTTCASLTTLNNGSTANAADVMTNFNVVRNCVHAVTSGGTLLNPILSGTVYGGSSSSNTLEFKSTSGNSNRSGISIGNVIASDNGGISLSVAGASTETVAMRIQGTTGNVGIGTTAPSAILHVKGTFRIQNGTDYIQTVQTNPNQLAWLVSGSGSYIQKWDLVNNRVGIGPDIAPLSTLDVGGGVAVGSYAATNAAPSNGLIVSGNVGIGTTSPGERLEVNGRIKVGTFASASATTVCQNANVLSSCSSSIRYKENVKSATFGLNEIMKLRPVTFKWKGRDENDLGFIAEEVEKINPLFATYKNSQIEGVKYPQLTAVLANAVKELKATNDKMATENTELKSRLDKNEQRLAELESRAGIRTAANDNLFTRVAVALGW